MQAKSLGSRDTMYFSDPNLPVGRLSGFCDFSVKRLCSTIRSPAPTVFSPYGGKNYGRNTRKVGFSGKSWGTPNKGPVLARFESNIET